MAQRPNLLMFLTDGMQAATVDAGHPCLTPNIDRFSERGVRFSHAHTTCPTCSPARASLMTGLLPHNHGVLEVEHGRDADQCVLRTNKPHFAQRLSAAGYRTGYFGKWHIERTNQLEQFGWQESIVKGAEHLRGLGRGDQGPRTYELDESLTGYVEGPPGYNRVLHWGVTDTPIDTRYPGITLQDAEAFIDRAVGDDDPWCCCVSFSEPNEALVASRDAWNRYDPSALPLPGNFFDDMSDRPNLYQREQQIGRDISEDHWRAARACYFARISELDDQFGRLMERLDTAGVLDNTIVVMLSDHGRYVGAHGFEAHNFGPFEEIYRIPLIISGPDIATGATCAAPISIADLCPTLCELGDTEPIDVADSRSFASLLSDPTVNPPEFTTGFAEYHGTRFSLTQRIVWRENWKFVFNGFDFDELYDLSTDPSEMQNLAGDPTQQSRIEAMMCDVWDWIRRTGDRAILETHYYSMRLATVGPNAEAQL
jgi:choline-sulfatase